MIKHPIRFTKMHGLGNDFVIINAVRSPFDAQRFPIVELSHRQMGIGFDQLLIVEPSQQADFFCRIFNADGSEAEQCGNGLRCAARFIQEEGLNAQSSFKIETKAGIFPVTIEDYAHIRVSMGTPCVQEKLIALDIGEGTSSSFMSVLSLGNPHAIFKVPSVKAILPDKLGPQIATLAFFPNGANVGFMEVINDQHLHLRTYERGIGETFACGSNACAAVVAGILNGWLKHQVNVQFRYGTLFVEWEGGNGPVIMTGPATRVFSGELFIQ
jgi:diaminopimelate epimerase